VILRSGLHLESRRRGATTAGAQLRSVVGVHGTDKEVDESGNHDAIGPNKGADGHVTDPSDHLEDESDDVEDLRRGVLVTAAGHGRADDAEDASDDADNDGHPQGTDRSRVQIHKEALDKALACTALLGGAMSRNDGKAAGEERVHDEADGGTDGGDDAVDDGSALGTVHRSGVLKASVNF